jgi:hypothetical protein
VAGDFFESVPDGADAYLLKSVVHDWDDDHAGRILAACRRATSPGGRLLLVERVVPERLGTSAAGQSVAQADLNMLVAQGGRERTGAELRGLLHDTGFELLRIVGLGGGLSLIEAGVRS